MIPDPAAPRPDPHPWAAAAPAGPFAPYAGQAPAYAAAPPGAAAVAPSVHGDRAGEHRTMKRGGYQAWAWVVLAFLMQWGLIALVGAIGAAFAHANNTGFLVLLCLSPVVGLAGAILTFRDRWRCIEAFSSRFCSGLAGLSMFYVPTIALLYANVRAVQRLRGR